MWEGGGYKYFLKLHITDFTENSPIFNLAKKYWGVKRSLKKVMKSAVKQLNVFIISFLYWESFMRKVALVVDLDEGIANRLVFFKSVVLKWFLCL